MESTNRQLDMHDLESDRLAADLKGAMEAPVEVPSHIDEEMRSLAQSSAARVVLRRTARWRWTWTAVAAAAAVLLVVGLWHTQDRATRRSATPPAPAARLEDIDGSGAVDILDAFLLARRIERRTAADSRWDLNGDGKVTQADVDRIALIAVSLGRGKS